MHLEPSHAPTVVDPVCGMTVEPGTARAAELYVEHLLAPLLLVLESGGPLSPGAEGPCT